MADTKDLGRLFVTSVRLNKNTRTFQWGSTVMTEEPFRRARPLVVHIPFTHTGIVIGWWLNTGWGLEEALLNAVAGWGIDPYDESLENEDVKEAIRQNVGRRDLDLDDEWEIISALGVER